MATTACNFAVIYYTFAAAACNYAVIYYTFATGACTSVVNDSIIACPSVQSVVNKSKGARDPPATHPRPTRQTTRQQDNNNLNRAGPRSNAPEQLIRYGAPLTPTKLFTSNQLWEEADASKECALRLPSRKIRCAATSLSASAEEPPKKRRLSENRRDVL